MKTVLDVGVLGVTILMMLTVGLELESRSFRDLRKQMIPVSAILLFQIILLPALGLLITSVLPVPTHLRMGILLIAGCPVGDMANFFTLLGKGNVALSVAINALSCLLAPISMVMIFAAYGRVLNSPFLFSVPSWNFVLQLLLVITIPILAGMGIRIIRPTIARALSKSLRFACVAGILALCILVLATRFDELKADWRLALTASITLALGAIAVGWAVSRLLRMGRTNSLTCSISFAVRNVGVAAAIAITMMNRMEYAVFSTVYLLSELTVVLASVAAVRLWAARRYPSGALLEDSQSW
jgi:bile acid:Na+ symporter, BASS family